MKVKQLWKGIFNFTAGLKRSYAYAYTERQATLIIVKRIAKDQGVYPSFLFDWMNKHPERYKIKLEVEFIEDEE
jgi:transposase-like protein